MRLSKRGSWEGPAAPANRVAPRTGMDMFRNVMLDGHAGEQQHQELAATKNLDCGISSRTA